MKQKEYEPYWDFIKKNPTIQSLENKKDVEYVPNSVAHERIKMSKKEERWIRLL